ncbi:MAG: PLP-dependent aspartate aminotransferase family protein [Candidatus Bipolaricaulia bacterium]
MSTRGFSTSSIHEAEDPEKTGSGDVITPINLSTTFRKEGIDRLDEGYVYSRSGNPTRGLLEEKLASLEKADFGLAFSSGMAAETNVLLSLLGQGDHVLACDDLYGGTKRLFNEVMTNFGLEFDYVDATDPTNVETALNNNTKILWLESPTNPLMKLCDIEKLSEIAHEGGLTVVVDNTFATPYFQQPLELGADLVVHSLTKYLGGHSDVVGGGNLTRDERLYEKMSFNQNAVGAVLSPFDSWLVNRGLKSLKPRMELHHSNAKEIASWLTSRPKVKKVFYPGLASHPQQGLAKKQMDGFGGMLSFRIEGGKEEAVNFVENLDVFLLAESLGGVESLVEIPSLMTHASMSDEERAKIGITDDLIRLSIGIEEVEDLLADLGKAFERV